MRNYSDQSQCQKQAYAGSRPQISKLDRKQILVNDLVGRLYADIERAVNLLGGNVSPMYSEFTLNSSLGLRETLLNIELTTTGLVGMIGEDVNPFYLKKDIRASVPKPDDRLLAHLDDMWNNLEIPSQRKETKAHVEIIRKLLEGLSVGVICPIPDKLTNSIVSSKDRDIIAKDFAKNNQTGMLMINQMAHAQSSLTEEALAKMENPHYPPQMPTKPLPTKIKEYQSKQSLF